MHVLRYNVLWSNLYDNECLKAYARKKLFIQIYLKQQFTVKHHWFRVILFPACICCNWINHFPLCQLSDCFIVMNKYKVQYVLCSSTAVYEPSFASASSYTPPEHTTMRNFSMFFLIFAVFYLIEGQATIPGKFLIHCLEYTLNNFSLCWIFCTMSVLM